MNKIRLLLWMITKDTPSDESYSQIVRLRIACINVLLLQAGLLKDISECDAVKKER